jgi:hypothetical protein
MPGHYEREITIKEAIANIDSRKFLLPAIQRNFVWSNHQICVLFDSLMRGYPINTFMMWDVKTPKIKKDYRFYDFLKNYCQRFKESNDYVATDGFADFKAVIDGQQRLTSLYIGLKGTYAYKQPRVWWPDTQNDKVLPPRRLYLDLYQSNQSEENESLMEFNFRFLTGDQYLTSRERKDVHWFKLQDVLNFPDVATVDKIPFQIAFPYLQKHGLEGNAYALETLTRLYVVIRQEPIIHYFNETSQEIDHVLDVFIRTNSGGTTLAFSDLLMSIAIANWEGDARKDIDAVVSQVQQSTDMGFSIGRDWVLKTCLMLTNADVKFKVKNFEPTRVKTIEENWPKIKDCIIEAFKLVKFFGLNDQSLRAKNAVIPIAHYLFCQSSSDKPLYRTINNLAYHKDERIRIARWLHIALLKGVFGGQSDGLLRKMREIINKNLDQGTFPLQKIIDAFKNTTKDLRFDDEYVTSLLRTEYGDPRCRSILALIFPEMNENQSFHIDHLHPKSAFTKKALTAHPFLMSDSELMRFYESPAHWNTIANLHLLNSSQNTSKNATGLAAWVQDSSNGFRRDDLLIDQNVSLAFDQFKTFFEKRHAALSARLQKILFMSDVPLHAQPVTMLDDDSEATV